MGRQAFIRIGSYLCPIGLSLNMVKSFESQVEVTASCWLWKGRKDKDGYGKFRDYFGKQQFVEIRAHRYAWLLRFGNIPEGKCVCHSYDNPACVNPAHLWLGSPKENNLDKMIKGRHHYRRVPGRTWSKITEDIASKIRIAYQTENVSQSAIAKKFGVSQQLVSRICRGEIW